MTPSEALFLCTAALIFFVTNAGGAAALITGIDKLPRVISIAAQPLGGRGLARILGIGVAVAGFSAT